MSLAPFAQQTDPLALAFMVERVHELLNDPEIANRVINGMRRCRASAMNLIT